MINKLWKSTLVLAGSSVLVQAVTALTYWLVARALLPEDFGRVSGAVSVATLLLTALDFGLNSMTVRQMSQYPDDVGIFIDTFSAKVMTASIVGASWILVTGLLAFRYPTWSPFIVLGVYIVASDVVSTLLVVPKSREDMQSVAWVTLFQKGAGLLITWMLISLGFGVHSLVLGLVAGTFASIAMSRRYIERKYWFFSMPSVRDLIGLWRSSAGFGVAGIAAQIQRLDVILLAAVAGPLAAGLYAAPARITNMVSVLPTALSVAILPRVARQHGSSSARQSTLLGISAVVVLSGIGLIVVGAFAETLVPWVLGNEYRSSVPVLRVLFVGVFFMCANAPIAALLQAEGRDRDVARIIALASLVGLAGVTVGGAMDGAEGAAFGYVLLQLAILIPLLNFLRYPQQPAV